MLAQDTKQKKKTIKFVIKAFFIQLNSTIIFKSVLFNYSTSNIIYLYYLILRRNDTLIAVQDTVFTIHIIVMCQIIYQNDVHIENTVLQTVTDKVTAIIINETYFRCKQGKMSVFIHRYYDIFF